LDEDGKVLTPEELLYRVSFTIEILSVISSWVLFICLCIERSLPVILGSAVCEHEPWHCTCSDGRQVPLTHLCGLKVSPPAVLVSHYVSFLFP